MSLPAAARTSSGVTVGTVTRIDGDTIYVKEGSGATVAVKLLSATTISKSQGVSSRAVRPGDSVTVKGTAGSGRAVKSTSISDSGGTSTRATTGSSNAGASQ